MRKRFTVIVWRPVYLLTAIGLSPGGSSTVHIYTQTIHRTTQNKQHKNFGRMRAVPRLCELYPGIYLTTEEKARKILIQGSRRVPAGAMKIHNSYEVLKTSVLLTLIYCLKLNLPNGSHNMVWSTFPPPPLSLARSLLPPLPCRRIPQRPRCLKRWRFCCVFGGRGC